MLDTNIVSHAIHDPHGPVQRRIGDVDGGRAISVIVAGELRYSVARKRSTRLMARVEELLDCLNVLPLPPDADRHYANIRSTLDQRGQPIGPNDLWIAAHALSLGATLVTDNVREFERVEGLAIENWLRG